jgi:hypothetical protein
VPVKVGEADITTLPVPVIALETRDLSDPVKTACRAVVEETIGAIVKVLAPDTERVFNAVAPPIVTVPVGPTLRRSTPFVVKAVVLAAGKYTPVSSSPKVVMDGAAADPAENLKDPEMPDPEASHPKAVLTFMPGIEVE